jgi:arsenate reductase
MPQALDPVTQRHIDNAAERLAEEFAGVFSQETIARYMAESQDLLGESKINVFVPVLAHRFTRERLKALAQVEGSIVKEQPEVLFVCVHNAGRSQMAAGLVQAPLRGPHSCAHGGELTRRGDQPRGGRSDSRARHRHIRRVPQATYGRGCPRG